jgi:hypothetical protein
MFKQALSKHVRTDAESIALVEEYVKRELVRPKTKWGVPIFIGILMVILPFGAGFTVLFFFRSVSPVWCYVISYVIIDLLLLRLFLIKLVECYQHYAKEELRRFCMCMPSCSEYSIAVLKKYPLAIGIFKIIFRLTVICDGEKKIHLP